MIIIYIVPRFQLRHLVAIVSNIGAGEKKISKVASSLPNQTLKNRIL